MKEPEETGVVLDVDWLYPPADIFDHLDSFTDGRVWYIRNRDMTVSFQSVRQALKQRANEKGLWVYIVEGVDGVWVQAQHPDDPRRRHREGD